jgi:hypothetical protein
MKGKIIGILVVTLLITAALPAVGTMNIVNNKEEYPTHISEIEWSIKYGEDEYDVFYDVDVTTDGGYIVCGNHEENGNYYPYVLKVDSEGTQQWNWTLREFEYNETICYVYDNWASAIMQTSDGGYVLCVYILFEYEGEDVLLGGLVKFDESGNFIWFCFIGEPYVWWFIPTEVIEDEDEEVYVVSGFGAHSTDPPNDHSAMLAIVDYSGTMDRSAFYDYGDYQDEGYALCDAGDGYLLAGLVSETPSNSEYRMIKTGSDLGFLKENTYGRSTGRDECYNHDCFMASDGGFIMGGQSYEPGVSMDAWAVRTDSDLNMIWNRSYGETYTDTCWSMAETSDEKYVLCVTINANGYSGDKDDTHLVKLNDTGKIEWVQINGGPEREVGISIKETDDGGFIVAGRDGTSYSKDADAVLTKFTPFSNAQPDKPDTPDGPKKFDIGVDYTYSSSTTDSDGDQVYYKWDWNGTEGDWLGPYNSGDTCEATHNWTTPGKKYIRVMTKDANGGESVWSDKLIVSNPRERATSNTFLLRLFERFPNLLPLFRNLVGFD